MSLAAGLDAGLDPTYKSDGWTPILNEAFGMKSESAEPSISHASVEPRAEDVADRGAATEEEDERLARKAIWSILLVLAAPLVMSAMLGGLWLIVELDLEPFLPAPLIFPITGLAAMSLSFGACILAAKADSEKNTVNRSLAKTAWFVGVVFLLLLLLFGVLLHYYVD